MGQGEHTEEAEEAYVPAGQAVQIELPAAAEMVPAVQGEHVVLPGIENFPGGQSSHAVAMLLDVALPAAHITHGWATVLGVVS